MLFFWIIIFAIILALSFLLANRSMKNAQNKIKPSRIPQSLFLIRQPHLINQQLLEKLHQDGLNISFERLFKGRQQAIALFGSTDLPEKLPELELLELEDYLIPKEETFTTKNPNKVNADCAFVWVIPVEVGMGRPNLDDLNLAEEEQFFYQVVLKPFTSDRRQALLTKKEEIGFKVTVRAMAATKNKLDKVKLAKRLFSQINQSLGIEPEKLISSPQAFEEYQFRLPEGDKSFTIREVSKLFG